MKFEEEGSRWKDLSFKSPTEVLKALQRIQEIPLKGSIQNCKKEKTETSSFPSRLTFSGYQFCKMIRLPAHQLKLAGSWPLFNQLQHHNNRLTSYLCLSLQISSFLLMALFSLHVKVLKDVVGNLVDANNLFSALSEVATSRPEGSPQCVIRSSTVNRSRWTSLLSMLPNVVTVNRPLYWACSQMWSL